MRTILISLLATAGIALATPASAQGFYFGSPGVGIQVVRPFIAVVIVMMARTYLDPRLRGIRSKSPELRRE